MKTKEQKRQEAVERAQRRVDEPHILNSYSGNEWAGKSKAEKDQYVNSFRKRNVEG